MRMTISRKKITVVSASDHKYFPLLKELIASVNEHKGKHDFDISIFDAGLKNENKAELEQMGIKLYPAPWPAPLNGEKMKGREYIKACVCRPFINKNIPGYDVYLWLDSDTWVQDGEIFDLFLAGAAKGKMACTVLVDRAFPKSGRMKWLGPLPFKPRSFYYSNAKKAFGGKIARKLYGYNIVSAGAFALNADAPHWDHWQKLITKALEKGNPFTAEQLSLGIMAHNDGLPMEYLPSWCNWPLEFPVLWDGKQRKFVEPYLPHRPIGLMHLSGLDEMRLDPSVLTDVKTVDGADMRISMRYGWF
jgi:hypothetical protein